jgi:hypothetical protein
MCCRSFKYLNFDFQSFKGGKIKMGWKVRLLGGAVLGSLGYYLGDKVGKAISYLIFYLPYKEMSKYTWFNSNEYLQSYQQYSEKISNIFGLVFGLTITVGFLAYYKDLLDRWDQYKGNI